MPARVNAPGSNYILGWSDAEQDRLIRQAILLAPMTEQLFREAGIGAGQRVLDIGSGIGDVAMMAARLVVNASVPLFSRLVATTHELFGRLGIDTERGLNLYRILLDAGLSAPSMHLDMHLGDDEVIAALQTDLLRAVSHDAERHGVSLAELGDLDTLPERIQAELRAAISPIAYVAMVSAWSRREELMVEPALVV